MEVNKVSFGNERPIYCVRIEQKDGSVKEVMMTESEVKEYNKEQEKIKEEKKREEELRKQQEWYALINRPQTFSKGE